MTHPKLKVLLLAAGILLANGAATLVFSSDQPSDNLSPDEIFKKAQQKYAALTSYSDEGKTVSSLNGSILTTTFSIKLARPNLYRVAWEQSSDSPFSMKPKPEAVWCAGAENFLDMGAGARKIENQNMALGGATGISGGAAATIPSAFFKTMWGNQLMALASGKTRQTDEKVGDSDCYVFTSGSKGRTTKLWIGKQDFLIHQMQNVTSAEAVKAMMAAMAKNHPGLPFPQRFGAITSTETHTNIVLNQPFSRADFSPGQKNQ
jgi:outer membrane lipoprotein-sorting protein